MKFIAALVLVCLALLWAFGESLPFGSEITVYNAFCTAERKDGRCNAVEQTAKTTTYKAFPEQQTVVYWFSDNTAPKRFWHCAVRDARNWSCQYGTELQQFPEVKYEMVDGEFDDVIPGTLSAAGFYRVPKWRWWWIRLTERR